MSFRFQRSTISLKEILQRKDEEIVSFVNFSFNSYPLKRQELKTQLNGYLTAVNKTISDCESLVDRLNGCAVSKLEAEIELSKWASGELQQQMEPLLTSQRNSLSRIFNVYLDPEEFKKEEENLAAGIQASRDTMAGLEGMGKLYLAAKIAKGKGDLAVMTFNQLEALAIAEAASKPKRCILS